MKFKKIFAVLAGSLLVGSTLGMVSPTSFVSPGSIDTAIVYGSSSAPSDLVAAEKISTNFKGIFESVTNTEENKTISSNFSSSIGLTEDEITLGDSITYDGSRIKSTVIDNKLSTLLDGDVYWDDGLEGSDTFDVHEEILIGDSLKIETTLDNNDLNGTALVNDRGISYRYVFEENIFDGDVLDLSIDEYDNADDLVISILGKDYEVERFDVDSITVSSSETKLVKAGDVLTVEGKTLTIDDIFTEAIIINGVVIKEDSHKKVNGIQVEVDTVAYHDSSTYESKALIKVGKDISTTYESGDAYVGEDEDEPEWIWDIVNPGKFEGYIGVSYDLRQVDEEDDLVYAGQSYILPENYAAIVFNGLNTVDYDNFELSFSDNVRLYNETTEGLEELYSSANPQVVLIEGTNSESFEIGSIETNKLAIHYREVTVEEVTSITYSLYYADEDNNDKMVFSGIIDSYIATLLTDDLSLELSLNEDKDLVIKDMIFNLTKTNYLGDKEDSESTDLKVGNKSIGSYDEDVLTYSGIIIEAPESNLDDDEVFFSVPSEQVYASVSVLGQGEEIVTITEGEVPQMGSIIVTDTEVESVKDKNLIVVGGSCINGVAAKILGVPIHTCDAAFTARTKIGAGSYYLNESVSPYSPDKVAVLIAGYNAADTTKGVDAFLSSLN